MNTKQQHIIDYLTNHLKEIEEFGKKYKDNASEAMLKQIRIDYILVREAIRMIKECDRP